MGSSFLNIAAMLASFQFAGTLPRESDKLNKRHNEGAILSATLTSTLLGIASGPLALLTSRLLINLRYIFDVYDQKLFGLSDTESFSFIAFTT